MSLAEEIAELLYRHDCVIVPDFGGFLSQYRPAVLQRELKRVIPPGKEIGFNSELKRNDGLLADRVGSVQQIGFSEAVKIIDEHVAEWEKSLSTSGRLELPGLGLFLRGKEGQLLFQPDLKADFSMASFGLKPTMAVPVQKTVPLVPETQAKEESVRVVPIKPEAEEPRPIDEQEEGKRYGMVYWSAAAIAALLVTGMTFVLVNSELNGNEQFANLWPFKDSSEVQFDKRTSVDAAAAESGTQNFTLDDSALQLDITGDERIEHRLKYDVEPAEPVHTYVEPVRTAGPYHIVIGCFGIEENAQGLIDRYASKGLTARILDVRKGLHRVVESSFATKEEALLRLRELKRTESKEAWLLKKD